MGLHFGNRPTKNTRFSLQIGSFFQGGTYVGNYTISGVTYGIVLAPISSQSGTLQMKTTDTATAGTTSFTDGWTNTNNMNDANHPAAQYARSLTTNGYNDWYIPSYSEVEDVIKPPFVAGNALGYDAGWTGYWTSTEFDSQYTLYSQIEERESFGFPNRIIYNTELKTSTFFRVRAVRRFVIQ